MEVVKAHSVNPFFQACKINTDLQFPGSKSASINILIRDQAEDKLSFSCIVSFWGTTALHNKKVTKIQYLIPRLNVCSYTKRKNMKNYLYLHHQVTVAKAKHYLLLCLTYLLYSVTVLLPQLQSHPVISLLQTLWDRSVASYVCVQYIAQWLSTHKGASGQYCKINNNEWKGRGKKEEKKETNLKIPGSKITPLFGLLAEPNNKGFSLGCF